MIPPWPYILVRSREVPYYFSLFITLEQLLSKDYSKDYSEHLTGEPISDVIE